MKKLMVCLLLGAMVSTSVSTAFAAENKNMVKNDKTFVVTDIKSLENNEIELINENQIESFNEFIKYIKEDLKDINKTDLKKLEKLYNEAVELEKDKNFDKASEKWISFDTELEKYYKDEIKLNYEMIDGNQIESFNEFIKYIKEDLKDINQTDLKDLEKLYNEAVELEKDKNFDKANKKWISFDNILDKYYKDGIITNGDIMVSCVDSIESFNEFMESMKEDLKEINKTDLKSLEKLYNEAIDLGKAEKFDKAIEKWTAFDKVLEKYYKNI